MLFAPITNAVHLCLDMQNLFAAGGIWQTPWMERVLPGIVSLAEAKPKRTVFTRFIPPLEAAHRPGQWQRYFEKWRCATRKEIDPKALELVPALSRLAPPATVIDKPAYSAFSSQALDNYLTSGNVRALIVTGAETDVCVLASVLAAVDRGYRVVVAEDALCSSSDEGHDALMTIYRTRFSEQIELTTLVDIRDSWADT